MGVETAGRTADPQPLGTAYAIAALGPWPVLRFLYRMQATGLEHIPTEGGFVLAASHFSRFDPWPLGLPLYPKRKLRYMSKAELFNPIIGPPLRAVGGFPVERGRNSSAAIDAAVELVRAGEVVAMFPEGTRRRKGLRKKIRPRAKPGAAQIALEAGVPLVPAGISGTDHLLRFGQIRVAYGAPIPLDDLKDLDRKRAVSRATERMMESILRLESV